MASTRQPCPVCDEPLRRPHSAEMRTCPSCNAPLTGVPVRTGAPGQPPVDGWEWALVTDPARKRRRRLI